MPRDIEPGVDLVAGVAGRARGPGRRDRLAGEISAGKNEQQSDGNTR
jgi:hypothetical protein